MNEASKFVTLPNLTCEACNLKTFQMAFRSVESSTIVVFRGITSTIAPSSSPWAYKPHLRQHNAKAVLSVAPDGTFQGRALSDIHRNGRYAARESLPIDTNAEAIARFEKVG